MMERGRSKSVYNYTKYCRFQLHLLLVLDATKISHRPKHSGLIPFVLDASTPCGGEVLLICLKMSRTKHPM